LRKDTEQRNLAILPESILSISPNLAGSHFEKRELVHFGHEGIDDALPWGGLPKGGLHEVALPPKARVSTFSAATGFAAALLRYASGPSGQVLLCQNRRWGRKFGQIYGPGIAPFGLRPNRVLIVETQSDVETLWAMEEGLRSGAIQSVLGEIGDLDLTASRRLQLAAEKSGALAVLLRFPEKALENNAALTRWHIQPSKTLSTEGAQEKKQPGFKWHATLWRCRGGAPNQWEISWQDEAFHCDMATQLADGLPRTANGKV
jgi:protein ImuA